MDNNLKIDKNKIAIVVIDLQKGIVSRDTFPHTSKEVIKNTVSLLNVFRKNKMPVFLVNVSASLDGKDRLSPEGALSWNNKLPKDWAELIQELKVNKSDFLITKKQWGAFYGTELDLQLRRRKIETIVLCGISTNIGVESTARFAYEYGYNQIFIEDAMAAMSKEEHDFSVNKIFSKMGRICKSKDLLKFI